MDWLVVFVGIIILIFGFVVFIGSPYVPSQKRYIKQVFQELYPLNSKDLLVDIGSGDGIVLREAARLGASAVGFEINPILVLISRLLSRNHKKIEVRFADFWLSNLPSATTVIYIFSVTRDMKRIMVKLQAETNRLGKPLSVISYGSKFDGLKINKNIGAYHLYILEPAN